jgi:phosphoesterase RecJ-like protein
MKKLTRSETAEILLAHDNYAIVTHRRPDGDTIGSSALLCMGLRQLGKNAHLLENPEITPKYLHLHEGLTKLAWEPGDTVISVDVAAPGLLTDAGRNLLERLQLRLDHHFSSDAFAPNELVDHTAGACADIIYDLLVETGAVIDKETAEALYTGVSTDTGCFRYANTTAHSYRVAAACMEAGGDLFPINQRLFDTNSLPKLRLQGWMAENTTLFAGGRLAVCALPRAVEQQIGVTEDDMDNVSGFPRSIEGVQMAAMLRENADGTVKISVRAVPGYDASAVCAHLGGGGHKGAAGATVTLPLRDAATAVAKIMMEQ